MNRLRVAATALALISPILVVAGSVTPAHADAASGTCASGYRLGSYQTSKSAYNWQGRRMYTITVRKRWCFSVKSHAIGSVYNPKPSIYVTAEFNAAWDGSVTDHDAHYTKVGPDGRSHPSYPKWGHVSWFNVHMCHTVLGVGCLESSDYKMGIISYWDGSKKLV